MGSIPVTGFGNIYVVTDEGNTGNVQMHENGFTLVGGGQQEGGSNASFMVVHCYKCSRLDAILRSPILNNNQHSLHGDTQYRGQSIMESIIYAF